MAHDSHADLRDVVEAMLEIEHCQTPAARDAILQLLPREMTGAIPRMLTARMDMMSIVNTCARYPGGLAELVEAIRLFAAGSIAMARLDAVVARRLGGPPSTWKIT